MTTIHLLRSDRRLQNRSGAMLVFVAIAMVGLMGMLTLTLDAGAGNRQRRIAQTAADAGAIAGGTQIYRGLPGSVQAAADSAVSLNGFPIPGDHVVNYPPADGPHASDSQFVQVVITKSIPSIFGGLFNRNTLDIRTKAVAGVAGISNNCVVSLAKTGTGLDLRGDLETSKCAVSANSTADRAIDIANGKQIDAPYVSAAGGISGSVTGTISSGAPPVVDPFNYVKMPSNLACTVNGKLTISGTVNLSPGVYCGGIAIGKNDAAILAPGVYVIRGGGLSGGSISGTGVTIINSIPPTGASYSFAPITFPQSCNVSITAPTTGPYAGIAFYGDPAGPAGANNDFCGKGDNDINGSLYFPNQNVNLGNGNGKMTITGAIIAATVSETNGGGRLIVISPSTVGLGPKRLSLVQ